MRNNKAKDRSNMHGRLNIVFVGEVDCGKSTLIGRLLYDTGSVTLQAKKELKKTCTNLGKEIEYAYLLDSFQEERQDEFTLDTTQAVLKVKDKEFLLIDVPGHEQLLKNMLTGTSYADAAVLVVDVNKSLEEQTKRHLYILKFLGIGRLIIVINKMDSIGYGQQRYLKVQEEIEVFLKESNYKDIQIIPVSAKEGDNLLAKSKHMKWDTGVFFKAALDNFIKEEHAFDFRFPVQDIYDFKKERLVVGMAASGNLKNRDFVKVSPSGDKFRVKAIKVFGKNKASASAGENIGLIFSRFPEEVKRGSLIYSGRPPRAVKQIQAVIFSLSRISVDEALTLICSTQIVRGKITRINEVIDIDTLGVKNKDANVLSALDFAKVTIDMDEPLFAESFMDVPLLGRVFLKRNNEIIALVVIN